MPLLDPQWVDALGNPSPVGTGVRFPGVTSDTADTSWPEIACLNMKRLLILSMPKESMLFGFHWNFIS